MEVSTGILCTELAGFRRSSKELEEVISGLSSNQLNGMEGTKVKSLMLEIKAGILLYSWCGCKIESLRTQQND